MERKKEIERKLGDAMVPGYIATFDPHDAECAGAFVEDALSEEDALASAEDLVDLELEETP